MEGGEVICYERSTPVGSKEVWGKLLHSIDLQGARPATITSNVFVLWARNPWKVLHWVTPLHPSVPHTRIPLGTGARVVHARGGAAGGVIRIAPAPLLRLVASRGARVC